MGSVNTPDFEDKGSKVLSPSVLAHVVLRTKDLEAMTDYYITFLGGRISYSNDVMCLLTYDHEHHRIALIRIPDISSKVPKSCGLDHIASSYPTLTDLMLSYRQRKARGIEPAWCVNHGPTTSLYYKDLEGNTLETQVDNFDTNEAANDFMAGKFFAENPIGTDFDPEELIDRIKKGEDDASLKKRVEIGPRGLPDF